MPSVVINQGVPPGRQQETVVTASGYDLRRNRWNSLDLGLGDPTPGVTEPDLQYDYVSCFVHDLPVRNAFGLDPAHQNSVAGGHVW